MTMVMDILAGIVSGLLMGTVFLWAGVFILWSKPGIHNRLARFLPAGLPPTLVMLLLVICVPPFLGLCGVIVGLLYRQAEVSFPGAGLGSPNLAFTLAVLSLAALVTLILLLARRSMAWPLLILNTAFIGIYGWILPLLANWR